MAPSTTKLLEGNLKNLTCSLKNFDSQQLGPVADGSMKSQLAQIPLEEIQKHILNAIKAVEAKTMSRFVTFSKRPQ